MIPFDKITAFLLASELVISMFTTALSGIWVGLLMTLFSGTGLVQSLNSTLFPPHIGAEPGRAKEESRITCMRMLRTKQ